MESITSLTELQTRRERLRAELAAVGDFRPGSLSAVMRRCGKANCACAGPDHPGHGPQHLLTRSVGGKTRTVHLRPGPELDKARVEVANYKRFRALVDELIEVNASICAARAAWPLTENAGGEQQEQRAGSAGQKKGSATRSGRRSTAR
ncbi:MAG: DUF6788 family protein [Sciscionella sp.]